MLIACEKCSTTYVLDDALIPPQGAPVQCTRCSHVFTARHGDGSKSAQTLPGGPGDEPKPQANQTMAFGARPAGSAPAAPAAPQRSQTMVFGGGASPASAPAAPAPQRSQTMVFGGGGSPASAPAAAPQRSQTMVFGGGGGAVNPPAASPAAPQRSQTMVFGGGGSPATAPAAAPAPGVPQRSQTMVFGGGSSPASAPAAAPEPRAPQRSQTMVFGGGSSPASAAAPAAAPTPGAPQRSQTMVFGGGSSPASAAAPAAAPTPGAPQRSQTMVFGSGSSPASPPVAPAAPQRSQTMVFGGGAAPAAPAAPVAPQRSQTMVFGGGAAPATPAAPAAPQRSQTMAFGAGAAPLPTANAPRQSQTMVFGAATPRITAGEPELPKDEAEITLNGPQPAERTVRVDLDAMMRAAGASATESANEVQARHNKTQRFAMTSDGAAVTPSGETMDEVQARHDRTAQYAMTPQQETTSPHAQLPTELLATPPGGGPQAERSPLLDTDPGSPVPDLLTTLPGGDIPPGLLEPLRDAGGAPLGDGPTLLEPGLPPDADGDVQTRSSVATTLPSLPQAPSSSRMPPPRIELPPEPAFVPGLARAQGADDADADVEQFARQGRRRSGVAIAIIVLLILGAASAAAWQLFGKKLLAPQVPEGAVETSGRARVLLRKDDSASRKQAIADLEALSAAHPAYSEAGSYLVIALSAELDDTTERVAGMAEGHQALQARIVAVRAAAEPGWEGQAEVLAKQAAQLKEQHSDKGASLKTLRDRLQQAIRQLEQQHAEAEPGSAAAVDVLRARAVLKAVFGDASARALAQSAATPGGPTVDPWLSVVPAELALNVEKPDAALASEALKRLDELRARPEGSTFLRAHVLAARLHYRQGRFAEAEELLTNVVTMRKEHDLANELMVRTREAIKRQTTPTAP